MALVLDTGPVLALLDADDELHGPCVELIESCPETLILVAPTLVEIDYWIRKRMRPEVWRSFTEDIETGAYRLMDLAPTDLLRVAELEETYASLNLGMVDASVIAVCEKLGETKVATVDRLHFGVVKPRHCDALRLLPE